MVILIPNLRYLFFVLLFFDFLKMVLPSFLIISDFYLNIFLSLTIPNNTAKFQVEEAFLLPCIFLFFTLLHVVRRTMPPENQKKFNAGRYMKLRKEE